MKIAINSEIIDTKDIWKIGELKGLIKNDNGEFNHCDCFKFEISIFNKESINIYSSIPKSWNLYCSDYHKWVIKAKINYEKISKFREQIIKVWSENQPDIPQFNL